jgi:hypothetical protein
MRKIAITNIWVLWGNKQNKTMSKQNFPRTDPLSRYLVEKVTSNGVIVLLITVARRLVVSGFEDFYSFPFFVFPIFPMID